MRQTKKIFFLLLCACFTQRVSAQDSTLKIGFTTIELILMNMPEAEFANKEIANYTEKLQQSIEIKYRYYQSEKETFDDRNAHDGWRSEDEKKAFTAKLVNLENEIRQDNIDADSLLYNKRAELLGPVQDKIQKAIDEIAKEGNYTYILNNSVGMGVPSILFGVEEFNITNQIAAKLGVTIPPPKTGQ